MAEAATWFYGAHGASAGPASADQLATLFTRGAIDGLTLVWSSELGGEWKPLSEVEVLKATLRAAAAAQEDAAETPGGHAAHPAGASTALASAAGAAAPAQLLDSQWHYADAAGVRIGPIPGAALPSLAAAGQITAASLVWNPGLEGGWRAASAVAELASIFESGVAASTALGDDDTLADAPDAAAADAQRATGAAGNKRKRRGGGKAASKENPWLYIVGLPHDVTEVELAAHFKRGGIIRNDPLTEAPRIKVYRDDDGLCKGDASLCYLREEAVELAITLLDGVELRPGYPLTVQQASFEHKAESGGGAAASAPKQPRRGKAPAAATLTADEQTARIRAAEQKAALSWAEEGDESTGLRIIVLGNVFDPAELAAGGPGAADELAEDVAEEVARFGEVERMTLFSQHESGPIMVRYRSSGAAAAALAAFDKRWFGGRQLECHYWDGKTDYRPVAQKATKKSSAEAGGEEEEEDDEEEARRLDDFGRWLESGGGEEEDEER